VLNGGTTRKPDIDRQSKTQRNGKSPSGNLTLINTNHNWVTSGQDKYKRVKTGETTKTISTIQFPNNHVVAVCCLKKCI